MEKVLLKIATCLILVLLQVAQVNGQNQVIAVTAAGDTLDLTGSTVKIFGEEGTVEIDTDGNVSLLKTERLSLTDSGDMIYKSVEIMPRYPGGENALLKFFKNHIQYPADTTIQGRVVLQFEVKKNGRVGHVKVVRSLAPEFDAETVRVCKMLLNFLPGRQNGQPVNVWYTLPVTFDPESR